MKHWIDKGRALLGRIGALGIPVHGAHACYFLVLSLFPFLVLILGLLRYTSLTPEDLMDLVRGFLPEALAPYAWNLIASTYENTSQLVVSVSALTAIWSASRGVQGLMTGLNAVYGVREHRDWLRTRILCAGYTVLFLAVLMLTLVLNVFGNTIADYLRQRQEPVPGIWEALAKLRFFLLVGLQTLLFTGLYMYLPSRNNGFRESLPGALLSSLGWMSVSTAFSVYIREFPRYANIFGSVYTVALSMLWLYLCVCIVFYGGVLNRALGDIRRKA